MPITGRPLSALDLFQFSFVQHPVQHFQERQHHHHHHEHHHSPNGSLHMPTHPHCCHRRLQNYVLLNKQGMGAQHSTTMQSTLSFVSSTTFSSIVSVQNSCKQTSNSTQNVSINVSTDPKVLMTCLQTAGLIGYDCSKLMANAKISGVSQGADVDIKSSCSFDSSTASTLQNSIAAQLQSKMSDQTDAVGQALMNVTQAIGGKSQTNVQMNQTITNTVNESFQSSTVNDMISAYATAQSASIDVNTAAADIANISQFIKLKAVSDMLAKNATLTTAANTVDAAMTTEESTKTKGLTDIVDSAAGVVNNAVDKGTGVLNNAIFGISIVWIGIGGAAVVGFIIVLIFMFKGGKSSSSMGPAGQMTNAYGPSPASQFMQMAPQLMALRR